jgi:ribose 5-phosphate isomerase A
MNDISQLKKSAAEYAVNEFVLSNMILGLGAGSTAFLALKRISELLSEGKLSKIAGIPCSKEVEREAKELGIPITGLENHPSIDVTIDGADEVDSDLNLIKGGGGAMLREKIVAQASKRVIIVIDDSKVSQKLGTNWPVPIEVIPFGWESQAEFIRTLEAEPILRITKSGEAYTTDQGNLIIDANFGELKNLDLLSDVLNNRAGIVGHGLFIDLATDLIVASQEGVQHIPKLLK